VWSWYEHRFGAPAAAEPNLRHEALAELETILPAVCVITQNIDGLHQRAGSTTVIELHGAMHSYRCVHGRQRGFSRDDFADQDEKPPCCPGVWRPAAPRGRVVRRGVAAGGPRRRRCL